MTSTVLGSVGTQRGQESHSSALPELTVSGGQLPRWEEWSVLSVTGKSLPRSPRVLDTVSLREQMMAEDRGLLNTALLLRNCCLWQSAPWKENNGSSCGRLGGVGRMGCSSWWRAVTLASQKPAVLPVAGRISPNSFSLISFVS